MAAIQRGSLLHPLPEAGDDEHVDVLATTATTRVERIVSHGQASPPGFWYDQDTDEWVLVISGRGVIAFDDGHRETLESGDWICLPAGCRHRVEETASPTIWLAVHTPPADTRARER